MRSVSVPGSDALKITTARVVAIGESRSVMTSAATGLSQNTQSAQFVPDHDGVLYAHETMSAPDDEDLLALGYVPYVDPGSDQDLGGYVPYVPYVDSDQRSASPRDLARDLHLPVVRPVKRDVSDLLTHFLDALVALISSGASDVFQPDPTAPRAPLAQDRVSPAITCQLVFSQREDEQDFTQAAGHPVKIPTGELVGVKDGEFVWANVPCSIASFTTIIGRAHVAAYLLLDSLDPHAVLDVGKPWSIKHNKAEVSSVELDPEYSDSDDEAAAAGKCVGLVHP